MDPLTLSGTRDLLPRYLHARPHDFPSVLVPPLLPLHHQSSDEYDDRVYAAEGAR